jgi:hypothetical protein
MQNDCAFSSPPAGPGAIVGAAERPGNRLFGLAWRARNRSRRPFPFET